MQTVDFDFFRLPPGARVLDLGCGEGRHVISAYLEGEVQSVGVDLALADLQATRDKFQPFARDNDPGRSFGLAAATALALPFADGCFDRVICCEVLEHIPDYRGALAEIRRVLRPGGLLCLSVPRRWPERLCWALSRDYHLTPGGHLRIFRANELCREVEAPGFVRYHRHWAHALHSPYWWLRCLFWRTRDSNVLVRQYHRLLVWDMLQKPALTRTVERLLNPLLGKSVVLYFRREPGA
ncbi:MAG: methyltransferase domain-containing protein [Parahaliea sp.]